MSISGRELIARLQRLIETQSSNDERRAQLSMAERTRHELQARGAEQHADEVFDLFRRARRDGMSMRARNAPGEERSRDFDAINVRAIQTVTAEMMNWGNFDPEFISRFFDRFNHTFEELLRDFNKTRSRRSHLTAIFRPFKERYVSAWVRYLDHYPTEQIQLKANELQEEVVTTENLTDWANRVFDLFVEATVIKPEMDEKHHAIGSQHGRMPVQLGLIRENSVEVYRGRWNEFLTLNRKSIEAEISGTSSISWQKFDTWSQTADFARIYDYAKGFAQATPTSNSKVPVSQVSVVLTLTENEAINAQRSWATKEIAASEIGAWLDMLHKIWASSGTTVTAKVEFSGSTGNSEVTVPPLSFDTANEMIPELIRNYV